MEYLDRDIFGSKASYSYQELTKAIMDLLFVKDRQAINYIKLLKEHGLIEKIGPNDNEFRLITLPF